MDRTWKANGEALRALREEEWFSQAELAERSGVSHATISKIEQGRRPRPHNQTIIALAEALAVDPDILRTSPDGKKRLAQILIERQGDGYGAAWDLRNSQQAALSG